MNNYEKPAVLNFEFIYLRIIKQQLKGILSHNDVHFTYIFI